MFPAATKGGGQAVANPDVCKVPAPPGPPVPTPFPNLGDLTQAQMVSVRVKIAGAPAITTGSKLLRTMGDEAGVGGGMVSGMNMGPASFKEGVSTVEVEGNPIVALLNMTAHNGSNANAPAGMIVSPSQGKVFVKK
jgi:hypothetical protein